MYLNSSVSWLNVKNENISLERLGRLCSREIRGRRFRLLCIEKKHIISLGSLNKLQGGRHVAENRTGSPVSVGCLHSGPLEYLKRKIIKWDSSLKPQKKNYTLPTGSSEENQWKPQPEFLRITGHSLHLSCGSTGRRRPIPLQPLQVCTL